MTPALDQISLLLAYSVIAVYVCAFIGYTLDLGARASARTVAAPALVMAGSGPLATAPDETVGEPPARTGRGARVGFALAILGMILHLAAVVVRGVAAGRVPWANMFEFSLTGSLLIMIVFVFVIRRTRLMILGPIVIGLVVILMGIATVGFYVPVVPLPPALQSAWLVIHVLVALLATAFFGIAFAVSGSQLLAAWQEKTHRLRGRAARAVAALPSTDKLDRLAYRLTIVGFTLWTFTLMAGAIWAGRAWGRYWGWDTKEVWTFIIWVVYAAYIHAKATRGWSGNRSAWLSVIGFAAVLFNFGIVNVFFTGLHSYSGLK
jgi:cytochrome c-type biogenesis protein CcsB